MHPGRKALIAIGIVIFAVGVWFKVTSNWPTFLFGAVATLGASFIKFGWDPGERDSENELPPAGQILAVVLILGAVVGFWYVCTAPL